MSSCISNRLTSCISKVTSIPSNIIDRLADEVSNTPLNWVPSYSEYSSDGFSSLSLYSNDGDSNNTIIRDCTPQATSALSQLPEMKKFLQDLGLELMWVRLNRVKPGGCLWEHRDYSELEKKERIRLHVPLITNPDAFMVLAGKYRIGFSRNALWKLSPADVVHGIINDGDETRIHVIIDCYASDRLQELLASETLEDAWIDELPAPGKGAYEELMDRALESHCAGDTQRAKEMLLKTFYYFNQPEGTSLDLVRDLYEKAATACRQESNTWKQRRQRFLKQERLENVMVSAV